MAAKKQVAYQVPLEVAKLGEHIRDYRKATHMSQWVFAKVVGIEEHHVRDAELLRHIPEDSRILIIQYLATAPRPRKQTLREVSARPKNVYLTTKLLAWARLTNADTHGVEAVRALKDAYERAKREDGLASIPLIQLEVENALTLATRGAYHRMRQGIHR